MITPYLDYGKACVCKELGLPEPPCFADGQIWYTHNGTPILIYAKGGEWSGLGAQSLRTGRLYEHVPKRIKGAVYCPTKEQYFKWVKNFKG